MMTSKDFEKPEAPKSAPKNDPTTPFQSAPQEAFDRDETDAATAKRNAAAAKSAKEAAKNKHEAREEANGSASEQKARNEATLTEVRSADWEAQKALYEGSGETFETPKEPGEG